MSLFYLILDFIDKILDIVRKKRLNPKLTWKELFNEKKVWFLNKAFDFPVLFLLTNLDDNLLCVSRAIVKRNGLCHELPFPTYISLQTFY